MSPHSLTSKYLTQVKPVNLHTAKNLVNNMTRKCLCETKLLHIMGANSSGLSRREVDALYLTSNEVQLFISNSGPCHLLLDLYSIRWVGPLFSVQPISNIHTSSLQSCMPHFGICLKHSEQNDNVNVEKAVKKLYQHLSK